jgi:hypothetical protein
MTGHLLIRSTLPWTSFLSFGNGVCGIWKGKKREGLKDRLDGPENRLCSGPKSRRKEAMLFHILNQSTTIFYETQSNSGFGLFADETFRFLILVDVFKLEVIYLMGYITHLSECSFGIHLIWTPTILFDDHVLETRNPQLLKQLHHRDS